VPSILARRVGLHEAIAGMPTRQLCGTSDGKRMTAHTRAGHPIRMMCHPLDLVAIGLIEAEEVEEHVTQ
jgi:hypothetical protein